MAGGRDYAAEYRRRKQRARELGFAGPRELAKARRPLRLADFGLLPDAARESRTAALRVVARARIEGTTVEATARELQVPMRVVRFWAGEALEPTRRGRTLPTPGDRLLRLRPLLVEGEDEVVFVAVRGSRAADRANRIFDVQWQYVSGRADESDLEEIRGLRVGGRTALSDPAQLAFLALANAIDPDIVYRELFE